MLKKKGRSALLIRARNRKLVERFFRLHEVERNRIDDVFRILSEEEFFLARVTIESLILRNEESIQYLEELKKKKKYLDDLKKPKRDEAKQLKLFDE